MKNINDENRKKIILSFLVLLSIVALVFLGVYKYIMFNKSGMLLSDSENNNLAEIVDDNNKNLLENLNEEKNNEIEEHSIIDTLGSNNDELLKAIEENQKDVTFAIFGTDERSTETSRSDIIMIIKYFPQKDNIIVISVPRDSRVYIPGYYDDKINHAFAFGGQELAIETLEHLFEVEIDYFMKFGFEDFKDIIDKLGGVKVNAKKDYGYATTIVPEGESVLNGTDALFYVRFRKDAEGDFGRIKRQQEVIKSLAYGIKEYDEDEIGIVLLQFLENHIVSNITFDQIQAYIKLQEKDMPEFMTYTLKTHSTTINGIWYEIINDEDLAFLKTQLLPEQ